MAATVSFEPLSLPETLSHTSRINSQFSEVRFSSVALAVLQVSRLPWDFGLVVDAYRRHRRRHSAAFETLCTSNQSLWGFARRARINLEACALRNKLYDDEQRSCADRAQPERRTRVGVTLPRKSDVLACGCAVAHLQLTCTVFTSLHVYKKRCDETRTLGFTILTTL